MKLILTNFRCYTEQEFEIQENDLTLISGQSGVGKSTIFSAIIFALFGTGTKLVTQGKSTCKVILHIEKHGLIITRTKKPNRLVLEKTSTKKGREQSLIAKGKRQSYEDAEAQVIINNIYGETYTKTSYIDQNNANSFLLLTPMEKLKFLENFSMKDIDINSIKKKVKDNIHNFEIKYKECSSARSILENMFKEAKVPNPPNEVTREKNPDKIKGKIGSLKSNHEKCKTNIKKLTESVKNHTNIKHGLEKDLINYNNKLDKIDAIQKEIDEYNEKIPNIDKQYIGGDELVHLQEIIREITEYKQFLFDIEKYREKENTIKSIDKEKKGKDDKRKEEFQLNIKNLTEEVEKLKPIFELCENGILLHIKKIIDIYEKYIQSEEYAQILETTFDEKTFTNVTISKIVRKKVKKYLKDISDFTKLLDHTISYECPHCTEKFYMDENIPKKYENKEDVSRDKLRDEYIVRFNLQNAKGGGTITHHIKQNIYIYNEEEKELRLEDDKVWNLIDELWGGEFDLNELWAKEIETLGVKNEHNTACFIYDDLIETFFSGKFDDDKAVSLHGLKTGNNKLVELRDTYEEKNFELKTLKKELEKLGNNNHDKSDTLQSDLKKCLDNIKEEIDTYTDFHLKIKDITIIDFPDIEVNTQNCGIKKFPKLMIITNIDAILQTLQMKIKDNTVLRDNLRDLKLKVKVLSGKKKTLVLELNLFSVTDVVKHEDEIKKCEETIQKSENMIKDKEKKLEAYISKIEAFNKYENYLLKMEEYTSLEKKLEESISSENIMKKKYTAYMLLKDEISKAESLSLLSLIESININANMYLDKFFPENPMCVTILPFSESKTGKLKGLQKPQINIDIQYKGLEYDISMLSGGELSRVIIAFTLSFAEIYNSDLILLDECTSNLDNENTTLVFNHIKEAFISKTVLAIAHQVVEGNYDNIMRL